MELLHDDDLIIDVQCNLSKIPVYEYGDIRWDEWCSTFGFVRVEGDEKAWCFETMQYLWDKKYVLLDPWGGIMQILSEDDYQELRQEEGGL